MAGASGVVSGQRLFKRICRATLIQPNGSFFPAGENAVEITDLRMKFQIERSVKPDPNACTLEIYNLSRTTRSLCKQKPLTVWLDAGYDNRLKQLFTGDCHFAFSRLDKPEWITKLQLRDGGAAYDSARHNVTYGAGIPVGKILADLAGKMDLSVDAGQAKVLAKYLNQQIPGARCYQGTVRDQLTQLLSPFGIQWSIQNSKLVLLRDVDTTGFAFEISQRTGMIGSPEWSTPKNDGKPNQIRVKCLLSPEIVAGSQIQIVSVAEGSSGSFRVQKVVHRGDTHGEEWVTEIEALPLDVAASIAAGADPIRWKPDQAGSGAPTGTGD